MIELNYAVYVTDANGDRRAHLVMRIQIEENSMENAHQNG